MPARMRRGSSEEFLIRECEIEDSTEAIPSTSSANNYESQEGKVGLKKELGLLDAVGILIGIMVGSGIFISPKGVVEYAGSVGLSLIIWAATGVLSTIGALCYAELGTMIPKSGGEYTYISQTLGNLVGFLYLWVSLLIISPTANTIMGLTFAYYILQPIFGPCVPISAVKLIAALVITFLTFVNVTSVKAASKVSDIFTFTKILALVVIIITGIYALATGHTENYQNAFEDSNYGFTAIATAYYQGFVSFAGWNSLNFIVEELKEPHKILPRAILISLPTVTLVYFLTNVAYFAVLSPLEVLSSNAVAVTFGNRMLGKAAWIISIFVACSTFGSINSGIFASSRLFFAGARMGQLPTELALISVNNSTPVPALLLLCSLGLIMLVASDIQVLINYIAFTINFFILLTIGVLLIERYKHPDRPRPFKIWLGLPIFFFVVCLFLVIFSIVERPVEIGTAIAIILSGIPVYFLFIYNKFTSPVVLQIKAAIVTFVQLITVSCPQEVVEK